MRRIPESVLLFVVFTLAPGAAWSQLPALNYTSGAGAITDITGGIYDNLNNECPPTQEYGANLGWSNSPNPQPRSTGGDGVWTTADSNTLDADGRTETTSASADATRGQARAVASANTSPTCIVYPNGSSIFMSAAGSGVAQFYDTYTVLSAPPNSGVQVAWRLQGSFSSLPAGYFAGGGFATLYIYLLASPPPQPVAGPPVYFTTYLVGHQIFSNPEFENIGYCFNENCGPVPKASVIDASGTIDVGPAFEWWNNRALAAGDSFIIGTYLVAQTRACGIPDGCDFLPAFTTDFSATATVVTSGGAVVSARAFRP